MANKKIAIVCDNYKVDKFKAELKKAGYTNVKTYPFTELTTTIKIKTDEKNIQNLHALCIKIQADFHRSN